MQLSEIGNKIKIRRNALGITQKDLAKSMNVSNQLISKWETGESVPSLEYLDALCKALDVDYSYFIAPDGENKSNGEVKSDEKKKRRKIKWNWKLFALILTLTWVAAFVAGFVVLTIFVFVPSANRTKYINDIEKSGQKYFDLGYYSINAKTELDGDAYSDYRYDGYLDENGKPVFHETKSKITVKDDVLTYDEGDNKYHYVPDKTFGTVEELAFDRLSQSDDDIGLRKDDAILDKISYIRKASDGYYLKFKDEYFTDELSGTQKKNFKLTDKIKGKIEIKNGLCKYMEITVKYLNKPDNERFTIKVSYEFIAQRPTIEHKNLEERTWNGTYVDDQWYSSDDNPDVPTIDTVPKCEELLSTEEFVSRLSDGTAKSLTRDFDFNSKVLNGHVKDGGDCLYYVDGNKAVIINKTDPSEKTVVSLPSSNGTVANVHVYDGNIFYTDDISYISSINNFFRVKNIISGETYGFRLHFDTASRKIRYNGGYAIYYGHMPNSYIYAYNVISLTQRKVVYSYENITSPNLDSYGNVYCTEELNGKYLPAIYKGKTLTFLKGTKYFSVSDGFSVKNFIDGDNFYTCENDTVYRYVSGKLIETLTSSDPRFKKNYTKLSNGYCLTDTTGDNIFDQNGDKRQFGTFNLKDENGNWKTVYNFSTNEIIAAVNGKLIVSTDYFDGYFAVYDENDLTKPLYYMKKPAKYNSYCDLKELEVVQIGSNTIIAVRINSVDLYGYELYYF